MACFELVNCAARSVAGIQPSTTGIGSSAVADTDMPSDSRATAAASAGPSTFKARRRALIAVGIAAAEAVLVLVGIVPWWAAVVAAAVSVAAYVWVGRRQVPMGVHTITWLAAVSQLGVVLVPVGIVLLGLLALVGVVVLAAVALTVILLDRR